MTGHEILVKARALIAEPEHWTQGVLARNAAGEETNWDSDDAYCWCAEGALAVVQKGEFFHPENFPALVATMGIEEIWEYNDAHTHAEVLAAFDAAIEATREGV